MLSVWKKTKELEQKVDEYLDLFILASFHFQEGLNYYSKGDLEKFEEKAKLLDELESKGDNFRRVIENVIYSELLIPESRGDVLAIIENADPVLNKMAEVLTEFSIQKPKIPEIVTESFLQLLNFTQKCVEEMTSAIRMYFKNLQEVRNHITAVMHFEHECDETGNEIKKRIFDDNTIDLCCKIQIAKFISMVQEVSDKAEDVCDRLAIYVIKRLV
jgi:predicted phosphate transport protein (TIGR00153 family)